MRAIVSAAGTGGHINPGIAIANKIKEKERINSVWWAFLLPILSCGIITGISIFWLQNHLSATIIICTIFHLPSLTLSKVISCFNIAF